MMQKEKEKYAAVKEFNATAAKLNALRKQYREMQGKERLEVVDRIVAAQVSRVDEVKKRLLASLQKINKFMEAINENTEILKEVVQELQSSTSIPMPLETGEALKKLIDSCLEIINIEGKKEELRMADESELKLLEKESAENISTHLRNALTANATITEFVANLGKFDTQKVSMEIVDPDLLGCSFNTIATEDVVCSSPL